MPLLASVTLYAPKKGLLSVQAVRRTMRLSLPPTVHLFS